MNAPTFIWLCVASLLGYAIGAYLDHPYIGLGIGFAAGVVARLSIKMLLECIDFLVDIF